MDIAKLLIIGFFTGLITPVLALVALVRAAWATLRERHPTERPL